MYADFIKTELLPELKSLAAKFAVWWTFKSDSLLKSYLNDREIYLDTYFRPDELLNQVLNILKHSTQLANSNVIVLMDENLQMVFNTWFIFIPDIIHMHLLPHIVPAPAHIANSLQRKNMAENFYVDSPLNIIYKDPSSVFWLMPSIDFAINKSTGNVYSWSKLLFIFTDFCTNTSDFFTRHSDTIIEVNDNTSLSALLDFKFFHIAQIETILKQLTKFLGRQKGFVQSCPFLKHVPSFKRTKCNKFNDVLTFIDDVVNNNNNLMPSVPPGLQL
jgi:hypothetical protein